MKLNEPIKEKKLSFFSWILFDPKAFKVIFIMSFIVGLLISVGLTFLAWYLKWGTEVSVIITLFAGFNIYNTIKQIKIIKYAEGETINDFVYKGKYKPKKVKKMKIVKQIGHDKDWPTKGGK